MTKYEIILEILKDFDPFQHLTTLTDNISVMNAEFYYLVEKADIYTDYYKIKEAIGYNTLITPDGITLRRPAPIGLLEVIQHDDQIAQCARSKKLARLITNYGLKHFWHYDQRQPNPKGFKEWIRCLRQPMHASMFMLSGYGFVFTPYTIIGSIQLFLAILINFFTKDIPDVGSRLLFMLWVNSDRILIKPYKWLFHFLMYIKYGKNWIEDLYFYYWAKNYPKFAELAREAGDE